MGKQVQWDLVDTSPIIRQNNDCGVYIYRKYLDLDRNQLADLCEMKLPIETN